MQPCASLIGAVKNELNHILTEPPFDTLTGMDMGWFCREHTLLTAMLLHSMGYPARICRGNIVVKAPDWGGISTFGTDSDHAWCVIDDVQPIDLSMTLQHYGIEDVQLVCGSCDTLSGFKLSYFENLNRDEFKLAIDASDQG